MIRFQEKNPSRSARPAMWVACALVLGATSTAGAGNGAFQYAPITEPIRSASFEVDFAALVAHRTIGTTEVNHARLVDLGNSLPDHDLSDDLFGTASLPDTPQIDMGVLETGIFSVTIDPSFHPALLDGDVGLIALFTDTGDAMFAIDFLSLSIETASGTTVSYYGWPIGIENNDFGITLDENDELPAPLPNSIRIGATGTGFDETISSKSIYLVPEPGMMSLLGLAGLVMARRRKQ